MGKYIKYISGFSALILALSLAGQERGRPLFTPVEVDFRLAQSPRFKGSGISTGSRNSFTLTNRHWGVIEISYKPHFDFRGRNSQARRRNSGYWLDDVVCYIRVVVKEKQGKSNPGIALFTAQIKFWTISLNGIEHKYFAYIPPMLIERAMPLRQTKSNVTKADTDNFCVAVAFLHKKWGFLGEGFYGIRGKDAYAVFSDLVKSVPQESVFHGALLSRANSPWGLNSTDHFDLEKPLSLPPPLSEADVDNAVKKAEEEISTGSSRQKNKSSGSRRNRRSQR